MHRITYLVPIALLAVCLAGCGAPKPIKYYAVQVPSAPAPSAATYPIDIMVARLTGPSLLQSAPIVYRIGTNQMGTYLYHRWADPPVEMVQVKLIGLLRNSREFQTVGGLGPPIDTEFVLRGRLLDMAEVDAGSITALVTMEFELYNRKLAKVLWSHSYSQVEPVEGKEVSGVVSALDRNLERGLKEVVAGLSQYFAANPPKKT